MARVSATVPISSQHPFIHSFMVCERLLNGSGGGPSAATAHQFVRAKMLPSGYLIRPCDGGGSIVHIVDHLDLEAWSVPEVLRPLYESSRVVAQKMTTAVQPVFTFANQAGLDMLETTLFALQDITLDIIFDEPGRKALCSDFAELMEQGFAYLPLGVCLSRMGGQVSYEQAIVWKVMGEDNNVHCLVFSFVNWSFV